MLNCVSKYVIVAGLSNHWQHFNNSIIFRSTIWKYESPEYQGQPQQPLHCFHQSKQKACTCSVLFWLWMVTHLNNWWVGKGTLWKFRRECMYPRSSTACKGMSISETHVWYISLSEKNPVCFKDKMTGLTAELKTWTTRNIKVGLMRLGCNALESVDDQRRIMEAIATEVFRT